MFQTKQPLCRKPSVGPFSTIGFAQPVAGPFLPFAQQCSKASPQPAIRPTQTRRITIPEVAVPASQDTVGFGDGFGHRPAIGAPRQRTQFILQFPKAFLARPFLAAAKVPAQKVEAFGLRIDNAGLGRMYGQSRCFRPCSQLPQRFFGFFPSPAQHDQVIGIAHHLPTQLSHQMVQRVEIQVRQKRTNHRSLGRAYFGRLPACELFQHSSFEALLQQRQDTAVHDALSYQSEQPLMRYRFEVAFEIQVHTINETLSQKFLHPFDRLTASASGPKPVAVLGKVPLQYRFEQVFYCCFHRAIAYRRDSQRSLFAGAGFGYPFPAGRLTVIAFGPQLLSQFGQLGLLLRGKLRHGLAIDSGCALVSPDRPKGRLQVALRYDFVPESKPYGCWLACFEPGQHALGPDRMFYPRPSLVDVSGLLRLVWPSHYRRSIGFVIGHSFCASTFLPPLAPRALPRFLATTDALTPAQRFFGPCGHERRSGPGGSPCLSRPHFQPFCPQPPRRLCHGICARSRSVSARGRRPVDLASLRRLKESFLLGSWPGLRSALAGSPVGAAESGLLCVMSLMSRHYGRVVHLRQLPTSCCHDAVAFGFRRVNVPPDRDFHPAVCTPSQAH